MTSVFIPAFISGIIVVIFSIVFKGKEKKDKGFAYNYFRLSYRRKFIRTFTSSWMGVLAIILIFIFSPYSTPFNVTITILIVLVFVIQAGYNYYMWKKTEE